MNLLKKLFYLSLCFCVAAEALAADGAKDGRLRIVATIFPEYDWVREILGDVEADVTLLLNNGIDLHSYQPTVDDMVRIAECDLFIYTGGESDKWVEEALKNTVNDKQVALSLLEVLGPSSVKIEEDFEADEHVWLSLRNAEAFCRRIAQELSQLDPRHSESYAANAANYIEKLSALDKKYQAAVDSAAQKVLLFADRFPFRYLVDDYGLKYYAAFPGCSAESEVSFETVIFLAGKVDEFGLPCVLILKDTRHKIAETVIANTKAKNQKVLSMDSMQSTTLKDIQEGASYLSVMEKNLETLKTALN